MALVAMREPGKLRGGIGEGAWKSLVRAGVPIPPGEEDDPFYSEVNLRRLVEAARRFERDGGTEHELIEV